MERVPRTKQPEPFLDQPENGVPITPDQVSHLQELDVNIEMWIADIDRANAKQEEFKQYVSRTHDYKNYNSR